MKYPFLMRHLPMEGHVFRDFACGDRHIVAVTTAGAIYEWGDRRSCEKKTTDLGRRMLGKKTIAWIYGNPWAILKTPFSTCTWQFCWCAGSGPSVGPEDIDLKAEKEGDWLTTKLNWFAGRQLSTVLTHLCEFFVKNVSIYKVQNQIMKHPNLS